MRCEAVEIETPANPEERLYGGINSRQPRIGIRAVVSVGKASILYEILEVGVRTSTPSLEERIR